jgi:hypothetical protein
MTVESLESRRMFANVTGLVLVNADTGKDIAPLVNGATLNLAALPTRHLSVRADASSDTQSVRFILDGKRHTENVAPYALAGNDGDVYTSWTPATGSHNLVAAAYTRDNAKGSTSQVSITFKVIDQPVTSPGEPAPEPQPQPPAGVTPPNIPGTWTLDWADEFNDNSLDGWNTNIWWGKTDGMGDEVTSPNNVSVSGGTLNLTATRNASRGYTSGLVTSEGLHDFQYGYVEAKMDLPTGAGFFPAFWMLPSNHNDGLGEIDIVEYVGGAEAHLNYHIDGPGDDAESDDFDMSSPPDQGYHTYGVDWQQDKITWYIDGRAVHATTNYTHTPMYVILNLAVGGDWAGAPNSQTPFPSSMKVDYVRVWEKAG